MSPISLLMRGARWFARIGGPVIIGVIAVCAIVYLFGPRIGLSSLSLRLYIIGAIIGLTILGFFIRWFWMRRRGKKMQSEMAGQQDPKAAEREAEIQALREKMDEAVAELKTSELGGGYRGAAALYALPWYMVIGPSAAGKSTLLCNSGLNFPLANSEDLHLRGFGGTRNCDWWFSDQAVILDTAGRYTTEDDDRDEWFSFLHMVRRYRKRMPLNGMIVAISVSEILTADASALERHVKIIRERVDEIIRELGMVIPVYLVFTKCDLVKGFDAYFGDLGENERAQVWGAYLLDSAEAETKPVDERFTEHMESLHARLCELRLNKLARERNLSRKAELFDFPSQFLAASETLGEFVRLLFRSNPYQETPMLAGVYLTSSTQEGTPLQRALGGLRQAFGVGSDDAPERQQAKRPFFIRRLFTDVIFQLPGIVRSNRRRMLWGRWLKGAAVATGLGAVALTIVILAGSYASNSLLISKGRKLSARVRTVVENPDADAFKRYSKIEELFTYYQRLEKYQHDLPWNLRLGIYSGDELIPSIEKILFRALGEQFRDPTLADIEYKLDNLSRRWEKADPEKQEAMRAEYYTTLRTYLANAKFTQKLDSDRAEPLMASLWAHRLGLAQAEEKYEDVRSSAPDLGAMVRFYLAREDNEKPMRRWPARTELVKEARQNLVTPPNAKRLYAQIRHRGLGKLDSLSVAEFLSADNRNVLASDRKLEGFYTADGWYGFVRDAIDDAVETATDADWVLMKPLADKDGSNAVPETTNVNQVSEKKAAKLRRHIREMYFDGYADHWFDFLTSIRVRRYGSLKEVVATLDQLARSDGPIGELMNVTEKNINLHEERPGAGEEAAKEVGAKEVGERVDGLEEPFEGLRRFTNPAENKSTSDLIHQYLLLLADIKSATQSLAASSDQARDAEEYAAGVFSGSGSDTELYSAWVSTQSLLNGLDSRTKKSLKPLLSRPIREAWRSITKLARQRIESQWQARVKSSFADTLANRFPFDADGTDVDLDKISSFFRPDKGKLWQFVDKQLDPYLERTSKGWRGKSWIGVNMGFTNRFLSSLRRAKEITDSLFRKSKRNPNVVFYLYPLPTGGVSSVSLESNGKSYHYRNGPQEWNRFEWPGDMQRIGARVAATISHGDATAERKADSVWGLFHLLRQARIDRRKGNTIKVRWKVKTGDRSPVPVKFLFRTKSNAAVLDGALMRKFSLPERLFPEKEVAAREPVLARAK